MTEHTIAGWVIQVRVVPERPSDVLLPTQTHSGIVATAEELSRGATQADGVITNRTVVQRVAVSTADCLPLVLVGSKQAAALHVSRKTLIAGLLEELPDSFTKQLTHAYIGPHICADHFVFEWEGDEITTFGKHFPEAASQAEDGIHLSLRDAVQRYAAKWNIPDENIIADERCTVESQELPSYKQSLSRGETRKADILTSVVSKHIASA